MNVIYTGNIFTFYICFLHLLFLPIFSITSNILAFQLPAPSPQNIPASSVAPGSVPPSSVAPGSVRPSSVPPGSVVPGSVPPGSVPPGSVPPGSAASSHTSGITQLLVNDKDATRLSQQQIQQSAQPPHQQHAAQIPPNQMHPSQYPPNQVPHGQHPPNQVLHGQHPPNQVPHGQNPPNQMAPSQHPPINITPTQHLPNQPPLTQHPPQSFPAPTTIYTQPSLQSPPTQSTRGRRGRGRGSNYRDIQAENRVAEIIRNNMNTPSSKVGKVRPQQQQRVAPMNDSTPGPAPTTTKAKTLGQLSGLVRIVSDEGKVINPGPTYLMYQQQQQMQPHMQSHMQPHMQQQDQSKMMKQQYTMGTIPSSTVSGGLPIAAPVSAPPGDSSADLLQQAMCEIGMDDELLGGDDGNPPTETITQVEIKTSLFFQNSCSGSFLWEYQMLFKILLCGMTFAPSLLSRRH